MLIMIVIVSAVYDDDDDYSVKIPVYCLSNSAKPSGTSKALKLGSKKKDVDTFVGQIQLEGESEFQRTSVFFV